MKLDIRGVREADAALGTFADTVEDLTPFWRQLGERLADEAQRRWPLRRRTGKLRQSLTWAGDRLGRDGVYEATPDRLQFGTSIFYGRFAQHGTKRQRARPLVHIDEAQHAEQLAEWLRGRADAAGLDVQS